jgi:soluble lytic murein transglycosylase
MPKSDSSAIGFRYPAGFRSIICEAAAKYHVDPLWLHAIIWQESKYDPSAHSSAAARGLMQFIPETANAVGSTIGLPELSSQRLYDPKTSIELGARYWASLLDEFKTPEMALAAYNGGPENVRRWKAKSPVDNDMFVADIGFVETKHYVMAVYSAWTAYRSLK